MQAEVITKINFAMCAVFFPLFTQLGVTNKKKLKQRGYNSNKKCEILKIIFPHHLNKRQKTAFYLKNLPSNLSDIKTSTHGV